MPKSFIVTLDTYNGCTPPTTSLIKYALIDSIGSSYDIVSVEPRPSKAMGKINTIRELRTRLDIGLRDAKFLVDMAHERGSQKWDSIDINYIGNNEFTITEY